MRPLLLRAALLTATLWLAPGCGEDFLPETYVTGLRVLSVRAEPAELRPGEQTRVTALVVDPSRPGRPGTLLWVGCDPDPLNRNRTACANADLLADPGALVFPEDGETPELPAGLHVLGLGDEVSYTAPAALFAELDPEDPLRRVGSVAQLVLLAIAEEVAPDATRDELRAVFERVKSRETPSVLALFRVRVSEDPDVNLNPRLSHLEVDGYRHPTGATLRVPQRGELTVRPFADDAAFESYEQLLPEGPRQKEEKLLTAWYSTLGRFKEAKLDVRSDVEQRLLAPEEDAQDPLPGDRRGRLWVVTRDTRGGQAWEEHPVYVCDAAAPTPSDVRLRTPEGSAAGGTLLELEGEGLEGVLEVELGGTVLREGRLSADGVWSGLTPPLEPGEHTLWLRTRGCEDLELPARYQALP